MFVEVNFLFQSNSINPVVDTFANRNQICLIDETFPNPKKATNVERAFVKKFLLKIIHFTYKTFLYPKQDHKLNLNWLIKLNRHFNIVREQTDIILCLKFKTCVNAIQFKRNKSQFFFYFLESSKIFSIDLIHWVHSVRFFKMNHWCYDWKVFKEWYNGEYRLIKLYSIAYRRWINHFRQLRENDW